MPVIRIISNCFGVSEALALHLIRSVEEYRQQQITIIDPFSEDGCKITLRYGDSNNKEEVMNIIADGRKTETFEEMAGMNGYKQKLSCAGIVYTKIGYLILLSEMPSRYMQNLGVKNVEKNLNRDFRKIYEYFIEIVDVFTQGNEENHQYMTSEKLQLLDFLKKMDIKIKKLNRDCDHFTESAELIMLEIGERFKEMLKWYEKCYIPAFQALVNSIKNCDDGVAFCNYDFADVSFNDLLVRASSTLRLPRLIIRPTTTMEKYRLEVVKLLNPALQFPKEWVGKEERIANLLGLSGIEYISGNREIAMARTADAARKLAYELINFAENKPELTVTFQEQPNIRLARQLYSLPSTRANSSEQKTAEKGLKSVENAPNKLEIKEKDEEKNGNMDILDAGNVLEENVQFNENQKPNLIETLDESKENEGNQNANIDENTNTTTTAINSLVATENNSAAEETCSSGANSFVSDHFTSMTMIQQDGNQSQFSNSVSTQNNPTTSTANQDMDRDFDFTEANNEDVGRQVEKVFRPLNKDKSIVYLGVPEKNFTISHVMAATIVGFACGESDGTLKLQSLSKPNSMIRIGPDVYDFENQFNKFTRAQAVSLRSFDIYSCDRRLSAAGIAFVLYGRQAIAKILAEGNPEKLTHILMQQDGKKKIDAIFRRTHKRLIQPTDEFVENQQITTSEFGIFHRALAGTISVANSEELSGEHGLACFSTALFGAMSLFCKLICSNPI